MSTENPGSVVSSSGVRLRTKIVLLPAIVSLFMVTIGVLSYIQLGHIEERVADVMDVQSPLANQASQLLQNTLQKDNVVARYLRTGDTELIQKFQDLSDKGVGITDRIQQLNEGSQHEALQALISTEKDKFNAVFNEQVVVVTQKRDAILTELLSVTAPKIESAVSDIVALSNIAGEVEPASVANEVLNSFLVARIYLGSYIQSNQEQDIERFELEMMGAESAIADLVPLIEDQRRTALMAEVALTLNQYSVSFEAIVESTKLRTQAVTGQLAESRLKLINSANDLQTAVWTQFESSGLRINESISETNTVSVVLTAIAVFIGMMLAFVVSRGISKPIVRAVEVADAIANDKLDNEIQVRASGEAGQLLRSLQNMQETLRERIDGSRVEARRNGRVKSALDSATSNVMMVDENLSIIYLNQAMTEMMRGAQSDIQQALPSFNIDTLVGTSVEQLHPKRPDYRIQLETLTQTLTEDLDLGGRTFRIVSNPVVDADNARVGTVFEWTDRTLEISVENEVSRIVAAAQAGDLTQRIDASEKVGFFKALSVGVNELVDVADCVVKDTVRVISALAQGDLTQTIDTEYQGAFDQLKCDANETVLKLRQVIGEVQGASSAVKVGVDEIVKGNLNLNQRTEEQAVYLVQTTSSMDELTSTVRQNADSANEANDLAAGANRNAEKGGAVVSNAVAAMGEINESSRKIADIIGVIDEIAFQTNLLALNAAVEAARAGEQGRGFAVVASEVRDLAQRSATAAKEIKDLIDDSVGKVNDGSRLVEESGQTLDEIVVSVKQVSAIVSQIAHASAEQSAGIEQVNKSVMQLDTMTQQNAVLVEEATSAAGAMGEQAQSMQNLMSFFSLHDRTHRDGQLVPERAVTVNRRAA